MGLHGAAHEVVHEADLAADPAADPAADLAAVRAAHHEVSLPASLSQQVVSVSVPVLEVLVDAHQGLPAL